jgi:hypothetical protein
MTAMAFMALVLSTVSLASLSLSNGVVRDTFWTKGEVDELELYIGVQKVLILTVSNQ